MTPQTPEQFREELRQLFTDQAQRVHELRCEFMELREEIHTMREGLTHAATPPATTGGTFSEMMIDKIVLSYNDDGKPTYKGKGAPYHEFGVKIWDEVLPALGIDPATLKPGTNEIEPIRARVLMGETKNQKTGAVGTGPRKVIGKV